MERLKLKVHETKDVNPVLSISSVHFLPPDNLCPSEVSVQAHLINGTKFGTCRLVADFCAVKCSCHPPVSSKTVNSDSTPVFKFTRAVLKCTLIVS
jgi:hypothetical protein